MELYHYNHNHDALGRFASSGQSYSNKVRRDLNGIYRTLSEDQKRQLFTMPNSMKAPKKYIDRKTDKYLKKASKEYNDAYFILNKNGKPVSSFNLTDLGNGNYVAGGLMTRSDEQGKGYANHVVSAGMDWYEKNKHKSIRWDVVKGNNASANLAKKYGLNKIKYSSNEFERYYK